MKQYPEKEYLTPLHKAVAKSLKNPVRLISAIIFLVAAILLGTVDFFCGCFLSPIAVFCFVATLVSYNKAKKQNGKFGLKFMMVSLGVASLVSLALAIIKVFGTYNIFKFPTIFPYVFDGFKTPLNFLNAGLLNPELLCVSVVLLFVSNLFYLCTLNKILSKNLPKTSGFALSVVFLVLSVGTVVFDILIRLGVVSFGYLASDVVLMYISSGIGLLLGICGLLQIVVVFYSIFKTRK